MKFIHIADLHLGRRLHGYDLQEVMQDALDQVVSCALDRKVDALVISGDVYDTTQPPAEAVRMLDAFLTKLCENQIIVMMISGNHDSAQRLTFANEILKKQNLFIAGGYDGKDQVVRIKDQDGDVYFHLLPFIKPKDVKACCEEEIDDYTDAFRFAVSQMDLSLPGKHILAAHQFFGGSKCESEAIVGTLDQVDASLLEPFDYCALGHLHNPQSIKDEKNCYSGTLLKFSTSEIGKNKSFNLVTVNKNGVSKELIPVHPLRDVIRIRGLFREITDRKFFSQINRDDYADIILEDETEIYQALGVLRDIYPHLIKITWENVLSFDEDAEEIEVQNDEELIEEFFKMRTGNEMDEPQKKTIQELWQEIILTQ